MGKASKRSGKDRRERLEQLKAQQRRESRRRNAVTFGAAGAVGVVILAAAIVPSVLHDKANKRKQEVGYVSSPTAAERAAGCTGVSNDKSAGRDHTTSRVDYKAIPPSSGSHNPDPLPATAHFFPLSQNPAPERAVHNLEHGFVVAWYDDKLPADQVSALQQVSSAQQRLVAVGWTRGDLPDGKHFVLTSWTRTERCEKVSPAVVQAFVAKHADDPKVAPEAGGEGGSNTPPNELVPSTGAMNPTPTATKK